MEKILSLNNISYKYQSGGKSQTILLDASYDFNAGTFYTILGPSGSGKTTMLSISSGLDVPSAGQVLFQKQSIGGSLSLQKYRKNHCAIIFQAYNLIPYMTALQNVITAIGIQHPSIKNKRAHAINVLTEVGLTEDQMKRPVLQLSGGQQQRVTIARALSGSAQIIFADEPTGNLDGETAEKIIYLFKALAHQKGKCIIMVTHDKSIAKQSDITLTLKSKQLVETM
ncbi:ABC transporter ATP-binding protein [Listeria grandensis FSL F6-0971]|uniref:ABC transporter ATP-binding protein n=1 Tax=Listeria grandensis FSL F6-0971 TaxID=1265819 RepID=W7BDP2_9LIST|nr:ABC transporter ATP-binding protein [Listeria grandensis]EUJ22925.1 ABC transporter ATP-binding protein [Listeria grandensis FSL F6-0971]